MPMRLCRLAMAVVLPLAAGCADIDYQLMQASGARLPGLPDKSAATAEVAEPPPPPAPEPVPPVPQVSPFAASAMPVEQAFRIFANDPMAQRYLALRALVEESLVLTSEIKPRIDTNIGALLPLTASEKPAAGLEAQIPPLEAVRRQFRRFGNPAAPPGPVSAHDAERAFLLDQLLPANPARRIILAPHDKESGRLVLQRLGRLADAGLITADERAKEAQAVEALIAGLPEKLVPPPPPEEPKKKVTRAGGSGNSTRRMPGGVSGKLEVIPSPLSFDPPKITADFKGMAGAHLLSMASATHGDKAWEALKNQFKAELADLSYKVSRTDLGELGVTYRLVAGPMEPAAAERLCGALRQKGQACMPTPFPE